MCLALGYTFEEEVECKVFYKQLIDFFGGGLGGFDERGVPLTVDLGVRMVGSILVSCG